MGSPQRGRPHRRSLGNGGRLCEAHFQLGFARMVDFGLLRYINILIVGLAFFVFFATASKVFVFGCSSFLLRCRVGCCRVGCPSFKKSVSSVHNLFEALGSSVRFVLLVDTYLLVI